MKSHNIVSGSYNKSSVNSYYNWLACIYITFLKFAKLKKIVVLKLMKLQHGYLQSVM